MLDLEIRGKKIFNCKELLFGYLLNLDIAPQVLLNNHNLYIYNLTKTVTILAYWSRIAFKITFWGFSYLNIDYIIY
ncbi:unnamed protein product [Blepharisma stoltei]|uniref:Uncharacterized protein n=1 Tax=Blepharisma stoltei TaxID=1481888 RepID=A0AAU9K8G3_9CILI|nr:unnamed protein product [Blepharisma stoltei]